MSQKFFFWRWRISEDVWNTLKWITNEITMNGSSILFFVSHLSLFIYRFNIDFLVKHPFVGRKHFNFSCYDLPHQLFFWKILAYDLPCFWSSWSRSLYPCFFTCIFTPKTKSSDSSILKNFFSPIRIGLKFSGQELSIHSIITVIRFFRAIKLCKRFYKIISRND